MCDVIQQIKKLWPYPPHFDFGFSKKKKKNQVEANLSITLCM